MNTFFEKVHDLIDSVKSSKKLSLVAILLLVAAVPLTIFIAQQQQDIRQSANTNQATITVPTTANAGQEIQIGWNIARMPDTAGTLQLQITPSASQRGTTVTATWNYQGITPEANDMIRIFTQSGDGVQSFYLNNCNPTAGTTSPPNEGTCQFTTNGYGPGAYVAKVFRNGDIASQPLSQATFTVNDTQTTAPPPTECPLYGETQPVTGSVQTVTLTPATNNPISQIQFTRIDNATVLIEGENQPNHATPFTYTIPQSSTQTPFVFRITKTTSGQAATVEATITDSCSTKSDFWGMGAAVGMDIPLLQIVKKAYAQTTITGAESLQLFRIENNIANTAAGRAIYLNCQEKGAPNVTPPIRPLYTGTCAYPLSPELTNGSYVMKMLAADGTTVIGQSTPIAITGTTGDSPRQPLSCTTDADCGSGMRCDRHGSGTYPGKCNSTEISCSQVVIRGCNPQNPTQCDDFTVCTLPPGWITPSQGNFSISGIVFIDALNNQKVDPAEAKLEKQTILLDKMLTGTNAERLATAQTNEQGMYEFSNIPPGNYRITYGIREGYTRATDDSVPLTLTKNFTHDFGIRAINPKTLKGIVYNDLNNNGQLDNGDTRMKNQVIQVTLPKNPTELGDLFAQMQTNTNGEYLFPELLAGGKSYRATILIPQGYVRSTDNSVPFTAPTTGTEVTQNFGVKKATTNDGEPTNTPTPLACPTAPVCPAGSTLITADPPNNSCSVYSCSPINPNATTFNIKTFLTGIGQPIGTLAPQHPSRSIFVTIINNSNEIVATKSGTLTYNQQTGDFVSTVDAGTDIPTGNYTIKINTPQFLRKQVPGIFTINPNDTIALPSQRLITGDVNVDNAINILDYNIIVSCFGNKINSAACKATPQYAINAAPAAPLAPLADLNDDGVVDGIDYNLFIRSLSTQTGD